MTAPKENRTKAISPMVNELTRYFVRLSVTAQKKHASNMIAMPLSRKTEDTVLDGDFVAMSIFFFRF